MIPPYLKSLAATVRDLVASGKALHVTESTAQELELLAGLFEREVSYEWPPTRGAIKPDTRIADLPRSEVQPITPADIAWAWLRLSQAIPDYEASGGAPFDEGLHEVSSERLKRAAE